MIGIHNIDINKIKVPQRQKCDGHPPRIEDSQRNPATEKFNTFPNVEPTIEYKKDHTFKNTYTSANLFKHPTI